MKDVTALEWEKVHAVHDYYDCPRSGIADYHGVPHAYNCEWDKTADDWSRVFRLSPINDEQLAAVKEEWSIWQRYLAKYHTGSLQPDDKHPALAVDWERHKQLWDLFNAAVKVDEEISVRAIPEFRGSIRPNWDFEVRWLSKGNGCSP